MTNAGNATATCLQPGGQVRQCIASGCGSTFYQTAPLAHSYTNMVCTRIVSCGRLNTSNSSHFTNYMYRVGNHARHIPSGSGFSNTGHRGIDVTNGSGTSISGFPIYAQGPGTAKVVNGSTGSTAGFYVIIQYDNGYVARYLHVQQSGRVAEGTRVTSQTRIAYTSNTGTPALGSGITVYVPHLHYDVIHINDVTDKVTFSDLGQSNSSNINPTGTPGLFPSGTFN
ncbi:MAG: M23 family metallopeptidase [Oscillospiraceae bacterium]|nr:M23 family metallopeptidase [Oscillospiraceae bacterium]